jgi:hypothetical protein
MIDQLESELRSALRARADELPDGARGRVRGREYHPRTRDLRPPVAAGALVAAAAAAAAVTLVDLGPSAPAAFAGWSRVPTHASSAQVADAQGSCSAKLAQAQDAANAAAAQSGRPAPLAQDLAKLGETTPVLTDTRGPFTFTVFDSGDANASCISGPGFTSVAMRAAWGVTAPAAGKIDPSFQEHTARAGNAYSFVEGRAGSGVTGATLALSDGSHVQATLQNGWLVAWWPGGARITSASVTTSSGTSSQTFDSQNAGVCPEPPSGSGGEMTCTADISAGSSGHAAGSLSINSNGG